MKIIYISLSALLIFVLTGCNRYEMQEPERPFICVEGSTTIDVEDQDLIVPDTLLADGNSTIQFNLFVNRNYSEEGMKFTATCENGTFLNNKLKSFESSVNGFTPENVDCCSCIEQNEQEEEAEENDDADLEDSNICDEYRFKEITYVASRSTTIDYVEFKFGTNYFKRIPIAYKKAYPEEIEISSGENMVAKENTNESVTINISLNRAVGSPSYKHSATWILYNDEAGTQVVDSYEQLQLKSQLSSSSSGHYLTFAAGALPKGEYFVKCFTKDANDNELESNTLKVIVVDQY